MARGSRRRLSTTATSARLTATLAIGSCLAVVLAIGTTRTKAQAVPEFNTGKNVDIVGPHGTAPYDPAGSNPFLLGDPDKKQQNEPSCDVSPNNPLVVFCGMNSYSAVDRTDIVGEPWVGASFTMDGGLTWKSHLHPGFKPSASDAPAPLVAPLGYDTSADPVVRLAPGIGLYTFIAFNRSGAGALLLGRWYERNIEGGFPYGWKDTVEIAKGTGSPGESGRFLDKPVSELSLLPGTGTYNYIVPDPTATAPNQTRVQKVPAGIVHVAYAVFTGNAQQDGTKIIYTRSTNYGDSWDPGTSLGESQSINQAPDIAVDPATNRVVVVWRRFADPVFKQGDAIMAAISNDAGKSFGKAAVVANICAFTQNSTSASFRTTTHPFVRFDGTAFHAVWAQRQGTCVNNPSTGYSRIVMSNLSFTGSNTARWSTPAVVDSTSPANRRGHEFQPAVAVAGKTLLVTWMDTRNDQRIGEPFPDPVPDPFINDYVFAGKTKVRRRSVDMFAAEAVAGQTPVFGTPKQVSRYMSGIFPGDPTPRALERNKVNARMFQSGKVPFHGDYTTAASVRFVLKDPVASPGEWISSAGVSSVPPVFHLAWTDNRLVRGDVSKNLSDSTGYTPPPITSIGETDPTTPRGACTPAAIGTRDQSVFTARITPAVVLSTASASKPTVFNTGTVNQALVRSYAVIVQNTSTAPNSNKTITLDIAPPAQTGVVASFRKVTTEFPAPLVNLPATLLPGRSSIARTIYVSSPVTIERPVVQVNVRENGAIIATTYLNPNAFAPPLDDPLDPNNRIPSGELVDSIEVHTPDILYRATSIGTPAIDDPAIDDPAIDDPAIDDPAIDDPAIDDPAIDDPAIDDPAIDDPAIDDPAIDDPAIDDPAIDDAAIASSSIDDGDTSTGANNTGQKLTQITWKVALKGNTTTSMSSKVFLNVSDTQLAALKAAIGPGKSQLLVSRRYRTSDIRGKTDATGTKCVQVRVSNYQVIANVVNPVLTNTQTPPDLVNPTSNEPSFAVPPGSAVYLTFRLYGNVPGFSPNRVGAIVQSQPGPPAQEPMDDDLPADQTAPVLTLPSAPTFKVEAEATGPQGATVTYTASANDDADGPVSVTCNKASGSTFPLGTTTVTCAAEDSSGNEASGTFDVIVKDTTAPVVTVPSDMLVEATGAGGAAVTFSASATDLVNGSVTPTCSPASGSTFALGAKTVVCSASDSAMPPNTATASFTVTVRDTTAPVVTVPASITAGATTASGVAVSFSASATDVVKGSIIPTCSPASGSTFPLGTTTVTCMASDDFKNIGTASFTVTVTDTGAPVISGTPANITVFGGSSGAVVTYPLPTAADAIAGDRPVTCSPASGSTFVVGTTTVICSASDTASPVNTATTTFTVTVVLDAVAPTITMGVSPTLLWPPDGAMVAVTVSGTANDELSGMGTIKYMVLDEYKQVQPSGTVPAANGSFSFAITLQRDRRGNDKDGRHYTIIVIAVDKAGNERQATPVIINVHDQSGG